MHHRTQRPAIPRVTARTWRRPRLVAAGLGLLAGLAFPPLSVVPALLLAIPGLIALIGAQARQRGAFGVGFWFGFGMNVIGLYWITEAILFEAARFWWLVPFAVPLLAGVLALFTGAVCALAHRAAAGWPRVFTLAGAWVLADLARQFILTGFPWNPLGSVWALPGGLGDVFLQPAAWIGAPGLTLLTVLASATPALGRRAMATGLGVLALWAGFGLWRLGQPVIAPPDLRVALVQGNIEQGQKWDQAFRVSTFERYLDLTRQGVAEAGDHPAVVIWPETASPFLLEQDANARQAIAAAARDGAPVPVLAGSVRFDPADRPRNSLMALIGPAPPRAIYDKWHLVPFGEYQPSWTPVPIQLVPGGGFGAGPGPQTLHIPGLPPVGALICYEAIFPAQIVDQADRPEWLVNVTNDAWFGNSTGPRQHLAAARMRAVEEGLPLLRAANTGITAAFDPFGREIARAPRATPAVLVVPLPGHLPPTLFSQLGLLAPGVLATSALGIGLLTGRRRQATLKPSTAAPL